MTHLTPCPWCQRPFFDEDEEGCTACGFQRQCPYCGTVISDADAMLLNNPKHCGAPACSKQFWDETNIPWQDKV